LNAISANGNNDWRNMNHLKCKMQGAWKADVFQLDKCAFLR